MANLNGFECHLKAIPLSDAAWRGAVIDACDSAFMAREWLKVHEPDYKPADVIALAALILRARQGVAEGSM